MDFTESKRVCTDDQQAALSGESLGELFVRGKWIEVPTLQIGDRTVVVRGTLLKIALIRSEEWSDTAVNNPEWYITELRKPRTSPWRADIFTFAQKLPDADRRYSYPVEWESIAAIDLRAGFKPWWEALPQATRKNVRRAAKRGVSIAQRTFDDDLVRELTELNNESPLRQGIPNRQYGKSFEDTKKDYSSFLERSDIICAYSGAELIGFMKLVYRGDIASILNFIPKESHEDKRPANAMMTKAIEICAQKGMSYVTYGLFNYGNKKSNSLREFKIRNGFSEVLSPRYYVPLSRWGAACMKLKLHHGVTGILPHSLISAGVAARAKWYDLWNLQRKPV